MMHDFLNDMLQAWASGEELVPLELHLGEAQECGNSYVKMGEAICEIMGFQCPMMDLIFSHAPKRIKNQLVREYIRHDHGLTLYCDVRILLEVDDSPSQKEFKALKSFFDKVAEVSVRENVYFTSTRGSLLNEVTAGRTDYSITFEESRLAPELMEFAKSDETLNKVFILLAKRLSRIGKYSWSSFTCEDVFGRDALYAHYDSVRPSLQK